MNKTHYAVSVSYDQDTHATYGPFTRAGAEHLAGLIESAAGHRDSVLAHQATATTRYTTERPRRVSRNIHRAMWVDSDTLELARTVASAEGITLEQALLDQAELFA